MRRGRWSGAVAAAAVLLLAGDAEAQSREYLDFDELTDELREVVDGSDHARMRSIGTSHEGREVWLVEVGDPSGTPLDERPGVLVVGNLSGDHLVGSALALETVRYLLEDPSAAGVRQEQVVYVVPRLNPDGAEAMFDDVRRDRRRNARPFDDDNDGRTDEDPPEDLDGDGMITVMRVPDPGGAFMVHPDDPRLMKRADRAAGERGAFTLHTEGVDSDGDGFLNEDGFGGVDLDRNWQHVYPYWERDAGPHMVSEPEVRALMDFVVAHDRIGAVLTFGHSDNLVAGTDARGNFADASVLQLDAFAAEPWQEIWGTGSFDEIGGGRGFRFGPRLGAGNVPLRGAQPGRDNDPQSGRRPAESVDAADREYFNAVAEAYREITGIEEVLVNREPEGAFFQVAYFQRGIPAFSTQGWGAAEALDGATADERALAWADSAGVEVFDAWTEHEHPELGTVEIGGFRPYATTNPPAEALGELGRLHGEFVVRLAGMLPRVRIVSADVEAHGGGVFTVTAEVENTGYLPTTLQHGVVSRAVDPTLVRLEIDSGRILTGAAKSSEVEKLEGTGSRARFSWLIRGSTGERVEILARSEHGGTDTTTVTLR